LIADTPRASPPDYEDRYQSLRPAEQAEKQAPEDKGLALQISQPNHGMLGLTRCFSK
jgi:hypothetical protein